MKDSVVQGLLNMIDNNETKAQIKKVFEPLIDLIFKIAIPYIYLLLFLLLLIFVLLLGIVALLFYIIRQNHYPIK